MSPRGGSNKTGVAGVIAAFVGLWPIVFIAVMFILANSSGAGEFTLTPRDTSRNVIVLIVALAVTLGLDLFAVVTGILGLKKGAPKGRSWLTVGLGFLNTLFIAGLVVVGIVVSSMVPARTGSKMSREDRIAKCMQNQKNIAIAMGPDMWGFDHPDMKPEELKNLDLSPKGDLVDNDTGIAYINDPTVLDCPADDDPTDVDYAVEITPQGEIKINCVDPRGIKEGHNP